MNRDLEIKLRLGKITRRSAELSAISSKLAGMASQLDRLRKLNGRIDRLGKRDCVSNLRHGQQAAHKFLGDSGDKT
jgi:hypothetical protein